MRALSFAGTANWALAVEREGGKKKGKGGRRMWHKTRGRVTSWCCLLGTRAQWWRHLRLAAPSSCAFLRFLLSADFSPSKTIPDKGFNWISLAQQCQGGRDILYVCFGWWHNTIPRFLWGGSKEERVNVLGRLLKKWKADQHHPLVAKYKL